MTWGIKIAEFLVEMELFPTEKMGSNCLILSPKAMKMESHLKWTCKCLLLKMTKTKPKTQADPYQETHDGWSGGVVAVVTAI